MELEGCDGPWDGSDTSLILSVWAGVSGVVSVYGGVVTSWPFG